MNSRGFCGSVEKDSLSLSAFLEMDGEDWILGFRRLSRLNLGIPLTDSGVSI